MSARGVLLQVLKQISGDGSADGSVLMGMYRDAGMLSALELAIEMDFYNNEVRSCVWPRVCMLACSEFCDAS